MWSRSTVRAQLLGPHHRKIFGHTLKKGSSWVCALCSVTEPNPNNRRKQAKGQISQSAARTIGGKGVSSLNDDDLDTAEELHTNAP